VRSRRGPIRLGLQRALLEASMSEHLVINDLSTTGRNQGLGESRPTFVLLPETATAASLSRLENTMRMRHRNGSELFSSHKQSGDGGSLPRNFSSPLSHRTWRLPAQAARTVRLSNPPLSPCIPLQKAFLPSDIVIRSDGHIEKKKGDCNSDLPLPGKPTMNTLPKVKRKRKKRKKAPSRVDMLNW